MTFTNPWALLALLLIPYFIWLGRPQGWARGRAIAAIVLRGLIVLLVVLGLSGLQFVRAADELAVVFLIDASDSMPEQTIEQAREFAAASIERMRQGDQAAIVVFGSDALVERPMSPVETVPSRIESEVIPLNTDLAEAIRLGMALYPPGSARRMVILSDGLANVGDAEEAARLAEASGVEIVAVPFAAISGDEIVITDLDAPTRLTEGQDFTITVAIESNVDTTALLRILGGGSVVVEENVALVEGVNRYAFSLTADEPGLTSFRAQIVPSGGDIFYQNNELSTFAQVTGPPRVLIVADDDAEITNIAQALLAQGILVDQVASGGMPADLGTLSGYQSIVLANVPARNLGPTRMEAIQTYVRDLGGGLVVVGGPNTYAPGGYFQTPLEETLPVEMKLRDQERLPQITVVYVIDRSGSMSDTSVGGIPKIELAKEAVIRSIELLNPTDRVGVLAFDTDATWVVGLTDLANKTEVARQVATLRSGGGTDIFVGLDAVYDVLPNDPGRLLHIVLLTDGGATETGIPEMVEENYNEHGITLSVIAIGEGYAPFLEDLPKLADGRFHHAFNVDTIPAIFTEETVVATRAYVIEGEFYPAQTATSPIMTGIETAPPVYGYVGTTVKSTAQQILVTEGEEDPLLAAWQYGLGRAVAWTSDATGRWASDWAAWPEFARFWSQAVRWTITENAAQNVEVRVVQEGETVRVIVDAAGQDGVYLNGLEMEANIVNPELASTPVTLSQVAPGRYEGTFQPEEEGAYFVRVAGFGEGGTTVAQTAGWVLAYSPEYRAFEGDADYLSFISGLTGGSIIEEPAEVFARTLSPQTASRPVWPFLLVMAVVLLPFDIAVRRLVITKRDWAKIKARFLPGRSEPTEPRSSTAGALLAAKERANQQVERGGTAASLLSNKREREEGDQPAPTPPRPQPERRPSPKKKPAGGRSTAAALLRKKREREEGD